MGVHGARIRYTWTELDWLAALAGGSVTPYKIPSGSLEGSGHFEHGQVVDVPLGLSNDPPAVARFFRSGYEWVPLPEGVVAATLMDLFAALFAKDPLRFAHFDPVLVAAIAAARDFALAKTLSPTAVLDPSLQPFGDLALLHFEYWENGRWRANVVGETVRPFARPKSGPSRFHLPWFGPHPWQAALIALAPQALPTAKGGAGIERVLARAPVRGAPIKALARPSGEAPVTMRVTTLPPPRIELDGWAKQTLVPFQLGEWKLGESKIRFRLTLPLPAARTRIEIFHSGSAIYAETHEGGEYLLPGVHVWSWDGYDQDGVLDTGLLAQNELSARLTVIDAAGRASVATTDIGTSYDAIRWVDARIDRNAKTVSVAVHARFSNPSEVELASFGVPLPNVHGAASAGLPDIPGVAMAEVLSGGELPVALHIPSVFDAEPEQFATFRRLIVQGIAKHWSRPSIALDGQAWQIFVSCHERTSDSVRTFVAKRLPKALHQLGMMADAPIGGEKTDMGGRSVNLATIAEGLPIIDVWREDENDLRRAYVGAHELGHSVLRETHNFYYSLTHKGTSTPGQQPLPDAPALPAERSADEIDVMLYYGDSSVPEWTYNRTFATEDDARGLVWMAKVVFG